MADCFLSQGKQALKVTFSSFRICLDTIEKLKLVVTNMDKETCNFIPDFNVHIDVHKMQY